MRGQRVAAGGRDGAVGQMPLHHVRLDDQHLEHIVQDVAGARAAMAEVCAGQQAQRFAIHLEEIKVEFGQIEFAHAEAQKHEHIVATPEARI